MAKPEIIVRGRECRDQFLELKGGVFPADAVARKHACWDWLFDNPCSSPEIEPHVRFVSTRGELVGGQMMLPAEITVMGQRLCGAMPLSTSVLPQHRGAGLRLLKTAFEEGAPPILCGLANSQRLNDVYEKLGGSLSPPRTLRRKVFKAGTVLRRRVPAVPSVLSTSIDVVAAPFVAALNMRGESLGSGDVIATVESFGDDFDQAWQRVEPGVRFAQVRRAAFLNWRYVNFPLMDYTRLALRRDGDLKGYVITGISEEEGATIGRIVDIFCYDADERDAALLLDAASGVFRQAGCAWAELLFGQSKVLDAAGDRAGYRARKEVRAIAVNVNDPDGPENLKAGLEEFHFCRGDTDEEY